MPGIVVQDLIRKTAMRFVIFLPRLLEFVAQGQFDNIHEVFSLRRINLASKENWREDEREILQQFACQYMTDWVSGDEAIELQYKLEMFFPCRYRSFAIA